jgi:nitrite reductase (NADH) large subunit
VGTVLGSAINVVIVGNGVAGVTAARTIKEQSPQTQVTILTDENSQYYPRPKLYEVLSGKANPQEVVMFSEDYYKKRDIQVQLNKKALKVDTKGKEIQLDDKTKVSYDKLLLANGAHSFMPPIKGTEKKGVFTLRTVKDAMRINEAAKKTKQAIVVGGGLLGLEFASALKKLGQTVTVVEIFERLLPRQLDNDGATTLKKRIESRDINIRLGIKTVEVIGKDTATGILLDNGETIPGNLVLFSAGIRSNTNLALESGIQTNRGIIVNKQLQTSADDVYAAGDVAEFEGTVYGIIPAAMEQARIAARNMIKKEQQAYTGTVRSNTLNVVNVELTAMGVVNPEDPKLEEIKETDKQKGFYKKLVLDQGKIVGAILLGNTKQSMSIKRLIAQKTDITKHKNSILKDDFDFKKVAA